MNEPTFRVSTGERPITLNAERRTHRMARAQTTRTWKEAAYLAIRHAGIGHHDRIRIRLRPVYPPKSGVLPDTGGLQPTEKAIIDALVDAGVIPDDNGRHVEAITSEAPCVADVPCPEILVRIEPVPSEE